jgi:hypothetical protein
LAEYPFTFTLRLFRAALQAKVGSPTHGLSISGVQPSTSRVGLVPEPEIVIALSEAATFDRDVVITLDGLRAVDGVMATTDDGRLALVGFAPPQRGGRSPLSVAILIDAAGPLGPVVAELEDLLTLLADGLKSGDHVEVAKFGRTFSPAAPMAMSSSFNFAPLGGAGADLGDLPLGGELPYLKLRAKDDVVCITDGRSRAADRLIDRFRLEERRLFILGVGASPDEGWLRPTALASGGDYMSLAPGEGPETVVADLLEMIAAPRMEISHPSWDPMQRWSAMASPWRWSKRCVVSAGFDLDADALKFFDGSIGPSFRPRPIGQSDEMADAVIRVAAAQRLPHLAGADRLAWARRFKLATEGVSWISEDPGVVAALEEEMELVRPPPMIPAGWRGFGTPFFRPSEAFGINVAPSAAGSLQAPSAQSLEQGLDGPSVATLTPMQPPPAADASAQAQSKPRRRRSDLGGAAIATVFVAVGATWLAAPGLRPRPLGSLAAAIASPARSHHVGRRLANIGEPPHWAMIVAASVVVALAGLILWGRFRRAPRSASGGNR